MKYIYHLLKHIKSFMFHPIESTRWLLSDLKKDINASNYDSKMKSVWCAGLPKSGTMKDLPKVPTFAITKSPA